MNKYKETKLLFKDLFKNFADWNNNRIHQNELTQLQNELNAEVAAGMAKFNQTLKLDSAELDSRLSALYKKQADEERKQALAEQARLAEIAKAEAAKKAAKQAEAERLYEEQHPWVEVATASVITFSLVRLGYGLEDHDEHLEHLTLYQRKGTQIRSLSRPRHTPATDGLYPRLCLWSRGKIDFEDLQAKKYPEEEVILYTAIIKDIHVAQNATPEGQTPSESLDLN